MSTKTLIAVLGLASAVAIAPPSYAADRKIMPGSACQPISETAEFSKDLFGRILNPSASARLFVDCPVVRDNTASGAGNAVISSFMKVFDANGAPAPNIICTFFSEFDTSLAGVDFATDSTGGSNAATLSFANITGDPNGYYHIFCGIPPGGNIKEYQWDEL